MEKVKYINCCIVEFGRRFGMPPHLAFQYLYKYSAIDFLDRHYEAEHLLPLDDTLDDLTIYCQRHGGTLR